MVSTFKSAGVRSRRFLWWSFGAYTLIMLWLLLGRRQYDLGVGYWAQIRMNINYVPFHTISAYLRLLTGWQGVIRPWLVRNAVINLAGNIIAFVPLGLFLPGLWPRLRCFWRFCLWVAAAVAAVELLQLFTLRGSCDVDDLILNAAGAALGFAFLKGKTA